MDDGMAMGIPLDRIAHMIQVALTPVFLLSGVGELLSVITGRLGRVADQLDTASRLPHITEGADAREQRQALARLRHQVRALDVARAFAVLAGIATCAATFTLFVGALQNTAAATALILSFGAGILCTTAALIASLLEAMLSARRRLPPAPPR